LAAGGVKLQIPPLRFASVGMTRIGWRFPLTVVAGGVTQQVPPLRFASVGMTLCFEGWDGSPLALVAGGMKQQVPPLRSPKTTGSSNLVLSVHG
jgi:hypothetical protein